MDSRSSRRIAIAIVVLILVGLALRAAVRSVARSQTPGRHPITGRQIAGIATDAAWLERSEREQEEAPDQAIALIGIAPGMTVADVGAGSGYMTRRLVSAVGPTGRVYATDIQPAMVARLRQMVLANGLANVTVVQAGDKEANLPVATMDLVLLVDVYHEFSYPQETLRSLRAALKPDGRLVLVEYRGEDPTIPIAPTHRMSVAEARTEVEAEAFRFDRLIQGLPRQHIIVFRPVGAR
jgi:FkbM family methyltransferase